VKNDTSGLKKKLRRAGLSDAAISAAWPTWWSEDASSSPSAVAELRFAIARKLGISPKSLYDDSVEFIWNDEARFKHLSAGDANKKAALASYGMAVGRILAQCMPSVEQRDDLDAYAIRSAILRSNQYVDLSSLLALCWGIGIPVIQLRVFPLDAKSMHAMVVKSGVGFAILVGREDSYPAPAAFTIAHEIGHIAHNHLRDSEALVDLEDPTAAGAGEDREEDEADRFALELLTGRAEPEFRSNVESFSGLQLADAALRAAPRNRIEPGTLALCFAYKTEAWKQANAALRHIYAGGPIPVGDAINKVASSQIDWSSLTEDSASYLSNIMGI